jgi:Glycosyltransferase family 87
VGGLVLAYAAGWAVLARLASFSRRAAEALPTYLSLPWKVPTILVGLGLFGFCAVHVGVVRGHHVRPIWYPLLLVVLIGLWVARFADVFATGGLFAGLGLDFGLYWAQARVLLDDSRPGAIYDTSALAQAMTALVPYARWGGGGLVASPVAYPPLFAWMLTPLARLEPPLALAVWTTVNAAGAVWLAWRVGAFFANRTRLLPMAITLTSVPVMMALSLGQPIVLLACAFGEFYLSLEAGKDLRAGVWLAALVFKPMYGVFIGPLLLWKRRWRAAAGAAVGVAVLVLASFVSVGPSAFLKYPEAIGGMSAFYGEPLTFPSLMINWRSLVVTSAPFLPAELGLLVTLLLGVLTVVVVAWTLRGPLSASSPDFPAKMTAVTLVTLLGNYHSNVHGAALLAVPIAALLARGQPSPTTRFFVAALLVVPFATLFDVVLQSSTGRAAWPPLQWAPLAPLLLAAVLVCTVHDCTRRGPAFRPSRLSR